MRWFYESKLKREIGSFNVMIASPKSQSAQTFKMRANRVYKLLDHTEKYTVVNAIKLFLFYADAIGN